MTQSETSYCNRQHLIRVTPITWPTSESSTIADNIAIADRLLASLLPGSTDLVCLPEGFLYANISNKCVQPLRGCDLITHFQKWSRKLNAYVFIPALQYEGDLIFSVVYACDRTGSLQALYRKMHPWPTNSSLKSYEYGVTPGHETQVVKTEFGTVGIQMCFDVNWSEGWEMLSAQDVKLIVFPSEYPGGFSLQIRAWQTHAIVVAAVRCNGSSRIIDFTGETIASIPPSDMPKTYALNLNACLVHLDHNAALIQKLGRERPEFIFRRLENDNVVRIEAPASSEPIEAVLEQNGIRTLKKYLFDAAKSIASARKNASNNTLA